MAWTDIPPTAVDADSPLTEELMTALKDNPPAIANGDPGAPRVKSLALQQRISFDFSEVSRYGTQMQTGFVGINTCIDHNLNAFAIIAKDAATAGMHAAPGGFSATVSSGNLRVYRGNFRTTNISVGGASGNGNRHTFIANDGFVYVCSSASTGIRKYDLLGNLIWTVALSSNPTCVWVDRSDLRVYCGDTSGRVYQITQTGGGASASISATWTGISGTDTVFDIVQDLDGYLYAGFNPTSGSTVIQKIDPAVGAPGVWLTPYSVAQGGRSLCFAAQGALILGCISNQRVISINPADGSQNWELDPGGAGVYCVAVNPAGIIAASNIASTLDRTTLVDINGNLLGSVDNSANFANYIRCELGDFAHHWDNIDPEAGSSVWQTYYPQAIEFASIIDQGINEEWPQ